jgi:hypothetical protein
MGRTFEEQEFNSLHGYKNFETLSGAQSWIRGRFSQWDIRRGLSLTVRYQEAARLQLRGIVRNPLQQDVEGEYLIKLRKLLRKLICVA